MRFSLWPHRRQKDLDNEIQSHLEMAVRDRVDRGESLQHASDAARRELGNAGLIKEVTRDQWGWRWLEDLVQDLRYAARVLHGSPGFTCVAVLSLALGIGANTAIFTLLDAVMLKMLPVRNPQELVLLRWSIPLGWDGRLWYDGSSWQEKDKEVAFSFPYPAFEELRARNEVFSSLFAFKELGSHMNVVVDGEAGLAHGYMATADIFTTLDLHPAAGRLFVEGDDRPGAPLVCVISHGFWKRRFGADPGIAGKRITIAGEPFRIAGVAPLGFSGLETGDFVDFWVPLSIQPLIAPSIERKVSLFTSPDRWWVMVMGRLKPGVSTKQAMPGLNAIFQPIAAQGISTPSHPPVLPSIGFGPPGRGFDPVRWRFSQPLFTLMGFVGLVLLIACANVANLLLARAASRQKEIGVRLSLGASRGRLIRQLLTESLLLACMGGALGYGLAYLGSSLLLTLISPASNPVTLNLSPDLYVLGFTAAACLVTGLLFGLAPAWRATRTDLAPALRQGTQTSGAAGLHLGWGKTLVVFQVALSLVLLFGAGLFVRTLRNLRRLDPGFDTENVLLFGLNPTKSGYPEAALNGFYSRVQQRIAALPGVVSATASWHMLLGDGSRGLTLAVPGYTPRTREDTSVHVLPVGPNFFATMKIPLLRGRDLGERDVERSPKVAVVNEAFAKHYLAGRDPMGQHFTLGGEEDKADVEIVGVVRDAQYESLREATPPTVCQPLRQASDIPYMYFEVRTAMKNPLALVPTVRQAVASIDPNIPLFGVRTQAEQIDELLLQERFFAKLTSFFGLLALLLACIGLYGILSYAVARRTREIGIRMALGALPADVRRMVLRETLLLVLAGVVIGVPASLVGARLAPSLISNLLFGLRANDASTIVAATAFLGAFAGLAGFLPARRATRVDPIVALRYE
jgi:predicted permease